MKQDRKPGGEILPGLDPAALASASDSHIKLALEHFSGQLDNQVQNRLVSELMAQYAETSRQLELKNRELAKSDASRREAQQIALLGCWEMNLETGERWWSDTMNRLLEADGSEKPNFVRYLERVHPEDRDKAAGITARLGRGEEVPDCRYRLLMKDGRVKWIQVRSVVSRDIWGNPVEAHGTIQDITAAKVAEEKLRAYNDRLEELVESKVAEISSSHMATIYALVKLAESRDDDTGGHIGRTSEYCRLLAEKLGEREEYRGEMDAAFIENIAKASPLHDIGKVGIPDAILLKPGPLGEEEREIMKTHVTIGYETLASVERQYTMNEFIRVGMDIVLGHHERWDGKGYPCGYQGEEIPLSARIMAVADVYDALRSNRVYKEGYSHRKSMEIIARGRGSHFDPLVTDLFLENHEAFREIFDGSSAPGAAE